MNEEQNLIAQLNADTPQERLEALRLLNKLQVARVALAGFDGFESSYDESYADSSLPHIVPGKTWSELNEEIRDMLCDFRQMTAGCMDIAFITESKYQDFGVL